LAHHCPHPQHDAAPFMHYARDAAARPGFVALGDDHFGGGNGGLHARDESVHLRFDGAEFGRARLGSIAVAKGGANLAGARAPGLRRLSKIIVMARRNIGLIDIEADLFRDVYN